MSANLDPFQLVPSSDSLKWERRRVNDIIASAQNNGKTGDSKHLKCLKSKKALFKSFNLNNMLSIITG